MISKKRENITFFKVLVSLLLSLICLFFINVKYSNNKLSILAALLLFYFFAYFYKKGFFVFLLFSISSICTFISLEVSFDLLFLYNLILSLAFSLIITKLYLKNESDDRFAFLIFVVFLLNFASLGFNVVNREDWILENAINVPFVLLMVLISRWFRFSKTSYSLFFVYMFMNVVGSHYTYSNVPFGFWLSDFFGLDRNHYDRIVHFCFGFLLAYPLREIYVRIGNYKGIWVLLAPVTMVFGLSSIYELLEWGIAVVFGGDLGIAYLGSQGDIWDAQKDMFLAGMGSIITMGVVFTVLCFKSGKKYFKELKESFRVKEKSVLGEVAVERMNRGN